MHNKKGFMLILILQVTAVVMTSAVAIIALCSDQIRQARTRNDSMLANYAAFSGAERMFTRLKSLEGTSVNFPITLTGTVSISDQNLIGNYTVTADTISSDTLGVVSTGTAGGKSSTVTVKYGYIEGATMPIPVTSIGPMNLEGLYIPGLVPTYIEVNGPLYSTSTITINDYVNVTPPDSTHENSLNINPISFWLGQTFDTNNDSKNLTDTDNNGTISQAEAAIQIAANPNLDNVYDNDDVNDDGAIDGKDAFIYYYTQYYNEKKNNTLGENLGIGPGEDHYYPSSQVFTSPDNMTTERIIFVDGDVSLSWVPWIYDDYKGSHTIIATGNIWAGNLANEPADNLVLISYKDVWIASTPDSDLPKVEGNLVAYAGGDLYLVYGGHYNGAIFAEGTFYSGWVMCGDGSENYNLILRKFKGDWMESPLLGVPPAYPTSSSGGFTIDTSVKPKWERN